MAGTVKPSMGCGLVVVGILLAAGIGLLGKARNLYEAGGRVMSAQVAPFAVGGVLLVIAAIAYLRFARRIVREARLEVSVRDQFPAEPWKWKKMWRGPAIESQAGKGAAVLWFFAIFWNAVCAPGVWAFFTGRIRDKMGFLVLIFPLVGLGLLATAVYQTVRWRKYGRARFVPSSLPGVIGGYLGGVIEVPARIVPEGNARLLLKCVRRETRGSGKNQHTTDNILWEHEDVIAPGKWMSGVRDTRIPVLIYIPPECLATDESDRRNEVVWRLSAKAATVGVDFAVEFVVPVFVTGETAAPPEAGQPLLEEYSKLVLDEAALRACGVFRQGDTFTFRASHLAVARFTTAVMTFGFIVLFAWFASIGMPAMVWGITIFVALVLSVFTLDVWFDGYELRLEGREVVVTKSRPWGTKVTRVARDEVAGVRPEKSMSSGQKQFFRLSLVGADGREPDAPVPAGETFRARKLRYQLGQLAKQPGLPAAEREKQAQRLTAELRRQPKFVVPFAKHIPTQARAEGIGALVLAAIRKK